MEKVGSVEVGSQWSVFSGRFCAVESREKTVENSGKGRLEAILLRESNRGLITRWGCGMASGRGDRIV
jgi:hypothetical protein